MRVLGVKIADSLESKMQRVLRVQQQQSEAKHVLYEIQEEEKVYGPSELHYSTHIGDFGWRQHILMSFRSVKQVTHVVLRACQTKQGRHWIVSLKIKLENMHSLPELLPVNHLSQI